MALTKPDLDIMVLVQTMRDFHGGRVVPAVLLLAIDKAAQTIVAIEAI